MTPLQVVSAQYTFPNDPRTNTPIEPRPLQADTINKLAPLSRIGLYAEVGTGKTLMGTAIALYKKIIGGNTTFVLMPPILLIMWYRWLSQIKGIRTVLYRGKPDERRQIEITNADFVLTSMGLFKNDFDHFLHLYEHRPRTVMVEEATSIKNGGVNTKASQNYHRVREFSEGADLVLLTGTPLSTPADGYGYVKLVSPTVYRNAGHFAALHVEERDFFDNITKWGMLDLLAQNLLLNSARLLKREALPHLKDPRYIPIPYELDPPHAKLYKKLSDEQLLLLDDGGKIDATTASKLYNCLQQIVCNPGHFSGDATMYSAAHAMIDSVVDQVGVGKPGGGKLLISANYKMTNRGLLQYLQPYGAVAIYSEVSAKKQQEAVDRFKTDPDCGICILNPQAGGQGLDGFQHVCNNVMFPELPIIPKDFHQVVGRLDRDGQEYEVMVHLPIAQNTIQVRLHNNLLNKDALVNKVQGGWQDLREAIYGAA